MVEIYKALENITNCQVGVAVVGNNWDSQFKNSFEYITKELRNNLIQKDVLVSFGFKVVELNEMLNNDDIEIKNQVISTLRRENTDILYLSDKNNFFITILPEILIEAGLSKPLQIVLTGPQLSTENLINIGFFDEAWAAVRAFYELNGLTF